MLTYPSKKMLVILLFCQNPTQQHLNPTQVEVKHLVPMYCVLKYHILKLQSQCVCVGAWLLHTQCMWGWCAMSAALLTPMITSVITTKTINPARRSKSLSVKKKRLRDVLQGWRETILLQEYLRFISIFIQIIDVISRKC